MRRFSIVTALAGLGVCATSLLGATNFGAGYRETWGAYTPGGGSAGTADPLYQSVWDVYTVTSGTVGDATYTPGAVTDYPVIQLGPSISTPNSIAWEGKNRTLVNKLNDGITNNTSEGAELPIGFVLKPDPTVPLNDTRDLNNFDNLQIRNHIGFNAGSGRAHSAQYVELSYGAIHAPTLKGGLVALANPIPVLALGKLHATPNPPASDPFPQFTGDFAPNASAVYFFNGQQWINTGLATVPDNQGLVAKIFYDSGLDKWRARIDYTFKASANSMGTGGTFDLAFDPTVLGFDTVSWNMLNVGTNPAGSALPRYDDVWIAGGLVVPEPVTVSLLGLGGLLMLKRRRGA